jgi:hypothetical protein
MGKFVSNAVLDASLNAVATANLQIAMNGQPATYAAAVAGKLCEVAMAPGDFTIANGDVSGRKTTIAAKAGLAVDVAGTADHVVLLNTTTSTLLYVTTCPAQALVMGGTISVGAWAVEINQPT